MYPALYQYLLLNKELPLPGVGTFIMERHAAVVDFPNKKINPPSYSFSMQASSHLPDKGFFHWLAQSLGITDREAIFKFNDFAFDLKKQLSDGDTITWNGVGVLNRGLGGDIKFSPVQTSITPEMPVHAEKVLRNKAEHTVRVGEDEKTAAEMEEMLNQPEEKKSYWWAWALATGLLATVFLGWYFSAHGLKLSSAANVKQLVPAETGSTYQVLP
jgi:hypothetical protein